MKLTRCLEFISRACLLLPQWPKTRTLNRDELDSCRLAYATIRLWEIICDQPPLTIVDVGARRFEESRHWLKHWHRTWIHAFDPELEIGNMRQVTPYLIGLSNVKDNPHFRFDANVRFDSLSVTIHQPALLKIDFEEYSYRVLDGFGERLNEFKLVVIEMWNDFESPVFLNQQAQIWSKMLEHGFNQSRVLTAYERCHSVPWYDMAFYKTLDKSRESGEK